MMFKYFLGAFVIGVIINIGVVSPVFAQHNGHVHGQGQLLIAQDINAWRFEFILPAADILGFEHVPQTQAQTDTLHQLIQDIAKVTPFLTLPHYCQLDKVVHQLQDKLVRSKADTPNEHASHQGHMNHSDITIAFEFQCSKEIASVQINLFLTAPSLSTLQAQWIIDKNQSASVLTPDSSLLTW